MALLTAAEMTSHIYAGVATAISQGDATILEEAVTAAILEAKGYCSRYRIAQLFDNEDADPSYVADAVLKMHVKNMARWNFITLANPSIDYEDAELRWSQAISWLGKIQSGKVVPPLWPPAETPEEGDTFFHVKSNPKRNNHY